MNIRNLSLLLSLSLVGAVQASNVAGVVTTAANSASDNGGDASYSVGKWTLAKKALGKGFDVALKSSASLAVLKILQGPKNWSIANIFGPGLALEIGGFEFKLKLMSFLKGKLGERFKNFVEYSDKSVLAAFVAYFWLNHCGGAAALVKGDETKDKTIASKRALTSVLLGLVTAYAVKEFNNSKLGKAAAIATALAAAATVVPTSVINRTVSA